MTPGLGSTGTLVSGMYAQASILPGAAISGSVDHEHFRDNWACNISPNRNVKIYIGAPGAAGATSGGYVQISALNSIAIAMRKSYSSFGGVMLWDASQAYGMEFRLFAGSFMT